MSAITIEGLVAFAAVILSAGFTYIPGLREKYAAMADVRKSEIMLGCLALTVVLIAASSCFGLWQFISCDKPSILELVKLFGIAALYNQVTYTIMPAPASVKAAKASRASRLF